MSTNIPPTRAVLLEARRSLAFARQGHDLLDRKRQALIAQALGYLAGTEDVEAELAQRLGGAYAALGRARMAMGVERVDWAALSVRREARVDLLERSVMGVPLPTLSCQAPPFRLAYSLAGTTAGIDRATEAFGELLALVCHAAEMRTAIWRLAREIGRTQRRVNALKNVLIPRYEAIVVRVEAALEEREREDFYRAKAVKRLQEERDGQSV